ncbi:MAG: sulfatase-like hydrolase/transferase, partial [Nannocystaceae bacterium]|nr:sulfatase-like hydrolase/transferase [Nannocystaceae bacterium]
PLPTAAAIATALLAPAALAAGAALASGPWISQQPFAVLVAIAPLLAAAIAAAGLLALVRAPLLPWRIAATAAVLPLSAWIDHGVQPGLVPEFHLALQVLGAAAMLVAAARWLERDEATPQPAGAFALAIAAAVVLAPWPWLAMDKRMRQTLLLRSPVAAEWIRNVLPMPPPSLLHDTLAALDVHAGSLAAPAPPRAGPPPIPPPANVVLVVVDTLRADALPPVRPPEGTRFAPPRHTPRLDAWIGESVCFARAYTPATETRRAMPAMMRSLDASDDPLTTGIDLGRRLEPTGLQPMAVAHSYFLPGKYPAIAALFDGFDEVRSYESEAIDTAVPHALELVAGSPERFFLVLHLFTLHAPGFDGALLDRRAGTRTDAYRRSLAYLDGQFGALLDGLAALEHARDTLVVVVGDHGEGLGDHGVQLHGPNLYEEDVRVPLCFGGAGLSHAVAHDTVGLIDLVPTIMDLLGQPPRPGDRGRSLVPAFDGRSALPERAYYLENGKGTRVGVVWGEDKLIYEPRTGATYRFDLRRDPHELDDRGASGDATTDRLERALVGFAPATVAAELERPAVAALRLRRLQELDPAAPPDALPLLLRLVALRPDEAALARVREIFAAGDDEVKLAVAQALLRPGVAFDDALADAVAGWLATQRWPQREAELVSRLAATGTAVFAPQRVAAQLLLRAPGHAALAPWLALVGDWPKQAPQFAEALATILDARGHGDASTLLLALQAAVGLEADAPARAAIAEHARVLLRERDPSLRAAATAVLGRTGTLDDVDALATILRDGGEDLRVRREAAVALWALQGRDALPQLEAISGDRSGARLVVRHLRDHGGTAGLPLLRQLAEHAPARDTRAEAARAVTRIEATAASATTPPARTRP